ncbi:MAG: hypothetical protein EXR72_15810 [Myxococcales bacterium]|nr:hypothetical protein [Myxococcales bacterium]
MLTTWTGCAVGFLLGMRHACEPDHVVAVATLVAERPGARRGALVGAAWGTGHAVALCAVGAGLVTVRAQLPAWLTDVLELGIAALLLALGVRSLRLALRIGSEGPAIPHHHGARRHVHGGTTDHLHLRGWTLARRPLWIGLCHGLAGSGALAALAMASMPSLPMGLLYMLLFGAGSIAAMALFTGLAGWPLRRLAESRRAQTGLALAAGMASLSLGILWGSPIIARLCGPLGG